MGFLAPVRRLPLVRRLPGEREIVVSNSTPSSLLWAFLAIGLAGLVIVALAIAGAIGAAAFTIIGIILLALGIVGAGFLVIAPRSSTAAGPASASASTAPAPAPAAPAPAAP